MDSHLYNYILIAVLCVLQFLTYLTSKEHENVKNYFNSILLSCHRNCFIFLKLVIIVFLVVRPVVLKGVHTFFVSFSFYL